MQRLTQSTYSAGKSESYNIDRKDRIQNYQDKNKRDSKSFGCDLSLVSNMSEAAIDADLSIVNQSINTLNKLAPISNKINRMEDNEDIGKNSEDQSKIEIRRNTLNYKYSGQAQNGKQNIYELTSSYDVVINSPSDNYDLTPYQSPYEQSGRQFQTKQNNQLEEFSQNNSQLDFSKHNIEQDGQSFNSQRPNYTLKTKQSHEFITEANHSNIKQQIQVSSSKNIQQQDNDMRIKTQCFLPQKSNVGVKSQSLLRSRNEFILQQIKKLKQDQNQNRCAFISKMTKGGEKKGQDLLATENFISQDLNYQVIQASPLLSSKNYLVVVLFVKKFINSLLFFIAQKDYRLLTNRHFQIINDKSFIEKVQNKQKNENQSNDAKNILEVYSQIRNKKKVQTLDKNINILEKLKQIGLCAFESTLSSFIFQLRVLQPNSLILIFWDILILFQLCLLFILVPARISFGDQVISDSLWVLLVNTIPLIVFFIDMFIGFHSGYYEYGLPVLDKKQVIIKYLRTKFWSDFLCIILILISPSDFIYLLTLILRINQVMIKVRKLNEHFQLQERFPTVLELSILILRILYVAHIFGCGFNFISLKTQYEPRGCWLKKQGILDSNWIEQYVDAVYFSIITMITIGYGDIYPINKYEKIYVIIMTFISCGLFAYCLNCIGEIFRELKQKSLEFTQRKYILSSYLNHMNISNSIKIRFLKYTEYIFHTTDQLYIKGQQIFDTCPQEMKEEVLKEYYGKKLLNFKSFRLNFSQSFLTSLSLKMKEQSLGPGESIIVSGQRLQKLYFINKGNDLEYYYNNGQFHRALYQLSSHGNFEVVDLGLFFSEQPSEISIRTKQSTYVSFISKEDFLETIKHYQNDYERYCMMRHQFLNEKRFDVKCCSCGNYSHTIAKCPLLHYTVQKETFTARLYAPCIQQRDMAFKRIKFNQDEKFHSLSFNQTVKHELKRARLNFVKERHSFLNDPELIEAFQFHSKDRYFFLNVPPISYSKDNIEFGNDSQDLGSRRTLKQNLKIKLNQINYNSTESQSYSDDDDEDEDDYENNSSSIKAHQTQEFNQEKSLSIISQKQKEDYQIKPIDLSIIEQLTGSTLQYPNLVYEQNEEDIKDENDSANKKEPLDQVYVKLKQSFHKKLQNQQSNLSNQIQFSSQMFSNQTPTMQTSSVLPDSAMSQSINCFFALQKTNEIEQNKPTLNIHKIEKELSNRKPSLNLPNTPSNTKIACGESPSKRIVQKNIQQQRARQIFLSGDQKQKFLSYLSENINQEKDIIKQSLQLHRQSSRLINPEEIFKQAINRQSSTSKNNLDDSNLQTQLSQLANKKMQSLVNQNTSNKNTSLQDLLKSNMQVQMPQQQEQRVESLKKNLKSELANEAYFAKEEHIFGVLKLDFDKVREYLIFFPQFNYTNIIRKLRRKHVNQVLKNYQNFRPKKKN